MGEGPVAGRDHNLKQIRADCDMSGNAKKIDHRRHPDVAGATAQKTAEETSYEGHQQDRPKRNPFDARVRQPNHWRQADAMNAPREMIESRIVNFRLVRFCQSCSPDLFVAVATTPQCFPTFPCHERGDGHQHNDKRNPDHLIDVRPAFEILNELSPGFHPGDRSHHHQRPELYIHVSKRPVFFCGDNRNNPPIDYESRSKNQIDALSPKYNASKYGRRNQ